MAVFLGNLQVTSQFALEANHRNVNGMNPLRATSYIGLVTYTWDWVSNLTVEYEFLWKYPLCDISAAQALYLATRYSPFLCHAGHLAIINITEKHLPTIPEQLCRYWFFYSLVTVGWSYELLLMNLMLRVYALYQRDWKIMLLFFFLTFVKTANIVVSWFLFIPAFTYTPSCMPLVKAPIGWMALSAGLELVVQAVPVYLTLSRSSHIENTMRQRRVANFICGMRREGVVCWSVLSLFSAVCISILLRSRKSPTAFLHITYPLVISFISIVCCRLILQIQRRSDSEEPQDGDHIHSRTGYLSFELDVHDSVWDAPTYEPEQDMAELANAERMGT